jgi:uncharacterized membrane protein YGL010W
MSDFFRRLLADYAEYHCDERNCATHIFGIPILFLGAVLPLSLWWVTAFGVQTSAASVMVMPALAVWILLDVAIGLAIVGAVIPLLLAAATITNHVSVGGVWMITAGLIVIGWTLQIVGHAVFEHRRPALLDNPIHMLIGPMFVIAKLFVAIGCRHDLAAVIQQIPQNAFPASTPHTREGRGDVYPHP